MLTRDYNPVVARVMITNIHISQQLSESTHVFFGDKSRQFYKTKDEYKGRKQKAIANNQAKRQSKQKTKPRQPMLASKREL